MKRIMFVDDEQDILNGLRRMLHGQRKKWDMYFCLSAEEALSKIDKCPPDVVISDMRMPIMDGAKFLARVKDKHPNTIRMALSGYTQEEMILESLQATQRFISKPAEKQEIVQTIEQSLNLQDSISDGKLKKILGSIESLPILPEIYNELMAEIASEDASIATVGQIVERDLALSASILQIVNSAFFGLITHVESPMQAATILGMDTIKNIALSTKIFSALCDGQKDISTLTQLNNFAQQVGLLSSQFAKTVELGARAKDHAQIAGMMVNLGEIISINYVDQLSIDNEQYDPQLIAGYMLGLWSMPYSPIEAVRWHREPLKSGNVELSPLTAVHAAWSMLKAYSEEQQITFDSPWIDRDYLTATAGNKNLEKWLEIACDFCHEEIANA